MPCKQCGRDSHGEEPHLFVSTIHLQDHSLELLRDTQLTDPIVGSVLRAKETDNQPDPDECHSLPLSETPLPAMGSTSAQGPSTVVNLRGQRRLFATHSADCSAFTPR